MGKKKPSILVVDDEESMVFSIQDYLSSYAECLGATSYDDAIAILKDNDGISLVISDIRMPGKDGFNLLMWLRENRPQAKVVMITAYGSPSVRALAKQKGAVMYLEKPLDLKQLLELVRQIMEHRGFSLTLSDMELADVLQFLSFSNKAARVQVFNAHGEEGEISLEGEKIYWVRSGTNVGEEAFYEIMGWEGGRFEVYPLDNERKTFEDVKLSVSLSFLLLEEARRRDEATIQIENEAIDIMPQHVDEGESIDIVKELAAWQTGVAGFVAASLTHRDGTYIAGTSNLPGKDLSEPAAYCAKAVKAIVETLHTTKTGHYQEVLITTDTHYVIWKKLTGEIFLSLTVTIDQGNLGLARLQMDQLGKRVIEELR
jgi:DNA-binding response OmpR family regulator/predicted regulator of Ras-like GTPase activity (Roadblock/LC7/MglB family)